jgi:ElaB/YqjD/DUF883 family membrane-anchored ribosome-binding protein
MDATHPTSDKFAKTAHETVDRVHSAAGQAEERIREKASRARDKGEELGEGVADFIRARPYTAMGVAAVAGLLIGALLRR